MKSLPPRPSLESLRKQAKKLARDRSLSVRDGQLALAREYGYAGWQDLTTEVSKRLDTGMQRAAAEAGRAIHDNDIARLTHVLDEYPALLSWHGADGNGLLGIAANSYGDSFDAFAEAHFTRAACAEALIDAGAVVTPAVCEDLLRSRARTLLQLFWRKGLLPRTLKFLAAVGDTGAVRAGLDENANDPAAVSEAFAVACDFQHEAVGTLLLDRSIALDPELRAHVDGTIGRAGFIKYFMENRPGHVADVGLWPAYVMELVRRAVYSWRGSETSLASPRGTSDLAEFTRLLHAEAWLLGDKFVRFQAEIIDRASLKGLGEFITVLLDMGPAILRQQPPPPSHAIEFAFTNARTDIVPLLTRIWPLPDDLPHAAGMGDLARVQQWFDRPGAPTPQAELDTALAWSVINNHFDVAEYLLEHGADINTRWSSHEPASILHELVWHRNYQAMQFLIDRGIDMTITDYRWNATAQGWALHAAKDEQLGRWLETAERQRNAK